MAMRRLREYVDEASAGNYAGPAPGPRPHASERSHPGAPSGKAARPSPAADGPAAGAYQARWLSRQRLNALRKAGGLGRGILVDHFRGLLVVEPVGSELGDGEVLPADAVDYELRSVWCLTPVSKLAEARRLLGLAEDSNAVKPVAAG